jgi:hypothetical protein
MRRVPANRRQREAEPLTPKVRTRPGAGGLAMRNGEALPYRINFFTLQLLLEFATGKSLVLHAF